MMWGIEQRKFRARDLGAVKSLIDETITTSYSEFPIENGRHLMESHHSRKHILDEARDGYTVVLDHEGRIIGTGSLLGDNIQRVYTIMLWFQ